LSGLELLILAWEPHSQLMRESIIFNWLCSWQRILKVSENFKAEFTVLLVTFVLIELVETAGPQLLSVLQHSEVLEVFGLSWVDWTSVHISLAVTQRCPAFHPLPDTISMNSIFTNVAENLNLLTTDHRDDTDQGEEEH